MNIRFLTLLAGALLTACSGSSGDQNPSDSTALVKLAIASDGSVVSKATVYGAVEQNADTQFTLSAPVEAVVSRIAAPVGTAVRRGQLVVGLTASPSTSAELSRMSAEARSAQQAYGRAKRLRADGLVSDAEVESARATAQGAQANRTALAAQAGRLALRAPGSGYVQSIASNPGDLVSAGATIATISRNGDLRARFGIDPGAISRLSRGSGLKLEPAGGGQEVVLPIAAVDPSVDPQSRLASIYVQVPGAYEMAAGQPLKGEVSLEQSGSGVVVPYAALLDDGGQPYVYVVQNGVAHRIDVSVEASDDDMASVAGKGLKAGLRVVVQGGTALEDGIKVRTK